MTIPTGSPESISSLASILVATTAYTGNASTVYYPEADGAVTGTWAVIDIEDGDHVIYLCSDGDFKTLDTLAADLVYQLPSLYRTDGTGLFIGTDIAVSTRDQSPEKAVAGRSGKDVNVIVITLPTTIEKG